MLNSNLLRKLDMQDLTVFVHVYERGSVTEVSESLCVSQSTVSYCLKKLRAGLEDELFVPARGGMRPTEKATNIYPHILRILECINLCYAGTMPALPCGEVAVFNVQAPEYFELLILPMLLAEFHGAGHPVTVNVEKFGQDVPVEEMSSGAIDLAICFGPNYHRRHPGLKSQTLLQDDLVCVVDSSHAPTTRAFNMAEFLSRRHVYPTPWSTATNMVDGWLAQQSLRRDIIARANTYSSAVRLLKGTNYILTLPTRIVSQLCGEDWVACCEPPSGIPSFTLNMLWNERADRDPVNTWFRDQISKVTSSIF
ncbi:LysR family transcriptional regulator [Pseudomonas benzenivorans]|uniref:LysR family transcriptional regulator n=1 Tax=Pseudomonas benzenivorans TaxID=556533 RepID=A0ABY5H830_9PSED|nr:LysR family transcriptional regulator [Pseudomonas benzenivorans]UTW08174.1 LysR family transcriptional regulator [Pseudomonas benzenivorans]